MRNSNKDIYNIPYKIVHISFEDTNGAGLCAYRIYKSQREHGLNSRLIVLNKKHKDNKIIVYGAIKYFIYRIKRKLKKVLHIQSDDIKVGDMSSKYKTLYTIPISPVNLTKLQILKDADIIHLHWVERILDYPSFFEAFKDKIIIWTLHDENLFYGIAHYSQEVLSGNCLENKYYQIKYNSVRKAKHLGIVFLSKMLQEKFGNHEIISGYQQKIIHNSVNSCLYIRHPKIESRKRIGIAEDIKIFAFCAGYIYDKRKGLKILSETLQDLSSQYRILAIGNNSNNSCPYKNVIEVGVISSSDEMSWIMSAADYFIMPSYQEAFAQTPIEAMACGLPVIAFPCSGTEELITPINGIRCEDFTSEALKKGIKQALLHEYDSGIIRQDVIKRFSPEKITKDYIEFYNQMFSQVSHQA